MKTKTLLQNTSKIEKQFLQWYKEFDPSSAYMDGINECAGKFPVLSKQNLAKAETKLESILRIAGNETERRLLKSYLKSLQFNEPYMVPSRATNAFFSHLVKEGIVPAHIRSLAAQVGEALEAYSDLLAHTRWSTEIRILTCQTTDQLLGILDTMLEESSDETVRKSLVALKEKTSQYRQVFEIKGISQGDFDEIYPILKKNREMIKHRAIYPQLLDDLWGYPETAEEIEEKAASWLKKELPILKATTSKLAKIYAVEHTVEAVEDELSKRKGVPREKALQFVEQTRSTAQKVFEKNIVKITPKYETKVMETPSYLVNLIPTAAMVPFDGLTDKPFNVFFITTDSRVSSSVNIPELVQSILHEEYGHAVNYSNSVTAFAANPSLLEVISSAFSTHISDGISFHRELEFAQLLRRLSQKRKPTDDEARLLAILRGIEDTETMLLENEFIVQKWRIMRFLRAVFDVRINMEKQRLADFIEWAHKETGLSEKMIYNETWGFLETVGYAPCYCIAGGVIRRLQQRALAKGVSLLKFNTYVSSLGFPAREIFEKRVKNYINKHSA